MGMSGDASKMNFAGVEFDQEQDVKGHETAQCPHFCAEEVGGSQH